MILDAEPDLEVVGEAIDGADAVRGFERWHPDVVVMDVRMPAMDGIEATRRITERDEAARCSCSPRSTSTSSCTTPLRGCERLPVEGPPARGARARGPAAGDALSRRCDAASDRGVRAQAERSGAGPRVGRAHRSGAGGPRAGGAGTLERRDRRLPVRRRDHGEDHVGRVLHKLRLRDRAQAVVVAYESGLVHPGA